MEWFSSNTPPQPSNASNLLQTVIVHADVAKLSAEIPIPPNIDSIAQVQQWYGRVRDRLLMIEAPLKAASQGASEILLVTPSLSSQGNVEDWRILHELQDIPQSICIRCPLYIESRTIAASYCVFRPDPRGWKRTVYKAASAEEANNLWAYLKQDDLNKLCFVGIPEPKKDWIIVKQIAATEQIIASAWGVVPQRANNEIVLGIYPDIDMALESACGFSARLAQSQEVLIIKEATGSQATNAYYVSQGRVISADELPSDS